MKSIGLLSIFTYNLTLPMMGSCQKASLASCCLVDSYLFMKYSVFGKHAEKTRE